MFFYDPYCILDKTHCTFQRLVEDKIGVEFVDGVVGEMHKFILEVVAARRDIGFRCEPRQTLLIHEYSQWVCACQKDIDPHIEFQTID